MNSNEIKIYSAENFYKKGFRKIIKKMVNDFLVSRELIWRLFLRDFKARYKQSLLGWLWIFLMPTITMSTFLFLNMSGVIKIGIIPVPYPIYGLLGFSLWQIFGNGWPTLTRSILSGGGFALQINFPKQALVFAAMGQVIIDFIIRLILVFIVYLVYGLLPTLGLLLLPFFILPIIFLTFGLSFIAAILNVLFRDTLEFIRVGLNFFLFLMPIMYTIPEKGLLATFNRYNPVYFLVDTPRQLIISGKINSPLEFLVSSIIAFVLFLLGWFSFNLVEAKLLEKL